MSEINYQALRLAAENATPGEWCADDYHGVIADAGLNANYYIASCSGPDNRANKRFIATAILPPSWRCWMSWKQQRSETLNYKARMHTSATGTKNWTY